MPCNNYPDSSDVDVIISSIQSSTSSTEIGRSISSAESVLSKLQQLKNTATTAAAKSYADKQIQMVNSQIRELEQLEVKRQKDEQYERARQYDEANRQRAYYESKPIYSQSSYSDNNSFDYNNYENHATQYIPQPRKPEQETINAANDKSTVQTTAREASIGSKPNLEVKNYVQKNVSEILNEMNDVYKDGLLQKWKNGEFIEGTNRPSVIGTYVHAHYLPQVVREVMDQLGLVEGKQKGQGDYYLAKQGEHLIDLECYRYNFKLDLKPGDLKDEAKTMIQYERQLTEYQNQNDNHSDANSSGKAGNIGSALGLIMYKRLIG